MRETVSYSVKTPDGIEHPDIMVIEGESREAILANAESHIRKNLLSEGDVLSSLSIMEKLPITFHDGQATWESE